jgi:hypothetical protein
MRNDLQERVVEYVLTCPDKYLMKMIKPAKYIAIVSNRDNRYLEINREVINVQSGRSGEDESREIFTLPALSYQ